MSLSKSDTMREATLDDIEQMAKINAAGFQGNRSDPLAAIEWITCKMRSSPIYQYFVIEREGVLVGYIGWELHGGFKRANPSVELEQLAIDPAFRGQKLAGPLIEATMKKMVRWIQNHNDRIESNIRCFVWGYFDNEPAHTVYRDYFPQVDGLCKRFGPRAEIMRYTDVAWSRSAHEGVA